MSIGIKCHSGGALNQNKDRTLQLSARDIVKRTFASLPAAEKCRCRTIIFYKAPNALKYKFNIIEKAQLFQGRNAENLHLLVTGKTKTIGKALSKSPLN